MFGTLRNSREHDEIYAFETTQPPYYKKRSTKLAKVACLSCRVSKLKCPGEPLGCQRCLAKKMECRYPAPSKSSVSAEGDEPLQSPSEPSPVENQASDVLESLPDDVISPLGSAHEMAQNGMGFDFELSSFDSLNDSDPLLDAGKFTSLEFGLLDTWQQSSGLSGHADMGHLPRSVTSWGVGDGPDNQSVLPRDRTPEAGNSEFCLNCLIQATRTHEAVEAALWSQRETEHGTNDVLQRLKKAMVQCDWLLHCPKCSA